MAGFRLQVDGEAMDVASLDDLRIRAGACQSIWDAFSSSHECGQENLAFLLEFLAESDPDRRSLLEQAGECGADIPVDLVAAIVRAPRIRSGMTIRQFFEDLGSNPEVFPGNVFGESSKLGDPCDEHPRAHVRAGTWLWLPDDGYMWASNHMSDFSVRWVPGQHHSSIKNIVASVSEGLWIPCDGYTWSWKNSDEAFSAIAADPIMNREQLVEVMGRIASGDTLYQNLFERVRNLVDRTRFRKSVAELEAKHLLPPIWQPGLPKTDDPTMVSGKKENDWAPLRMQSKSGNLGSAGPAEKARDSDFDDWIPESPPEYDIYDYQNRL